MAFVSYYNLELKMISASAHFLFSTEQQVLKKEINPKGVQILKSHMFKAMLVIKTEALNLD